MSSSNLFATSAIKSDLMSARHHLQVVRPNGHDGCHYHRFDAVVLDYCFFGTCDLAVCSSKVPRLCSDDLQ